MSYDKLIERPQLPFDRLRIEQGGPSLGDYMQRLLEEIETRFRDVNRYANHFRDWTHASDFNKIDGGDHYAGSILMAAVGLAQITKVGSALTQAPALIGDSWSIEQTLSYDDSVGVTMILLWGAEVFFNAAGATTVSLMLYRGDTALQTLGPITTVSGQPPNKGTVFVETAPAGDLTYTLRTATGGGGLANIANIYIVALESKR